MTASVDKAAIAAQKPGTASGEFTVSEQASKLAYAYVVGRREFPGDPEKLSIVLSDAPVPEGGIAGRGLIHRWAAGFLMGLCGYHLLYILFTERGHDQFMQMRPGRQDIRDFVRLMQLNLGRPVLRPAFDRFDYRQKFQYWVFFLAGATMIVSGLVLWFATEAMAVMPKWLFDLLALLHGRESVVIFLVLFLWHLYDVHFRPEVFPMDWSWITGRIRLADLKQRHPAEYERLRQAGVIDDDA